MSDLKLIKTVCFFRAGITNAKNAMRQRIPQRISIFALIFLLGFSLNMFAAEQPVDLLETKITIEAIDASLSSVLQNMARMSGSNIVLAVDTITEREEDKEPKITVSLRDIPIEQALSLVVKAVGLSYRLIGDNTFLVGDKTRIQEEVGERSYVVNLNYVDVDKIVTALAILPGEAVAIQGQNAILLRANPVTFAEISRRIQEIDIPQQQVEIRARVIEVSLTDSKKIGIDWSRLNRLTTILAENPSNADGIGLPFRYTDETGALPHGSLNPFGELPDQQYFQKMDSWSDVGKFSRQMTAFDITIDWLLENNAAKLLTDTRLTALNGEDAEILIGEVVPFVVQDREYNVQVEREEVGIILKVTPTVNKDGQITTKISPEVSSVTELVAGYVPRTKMRRVHSTVTVPNGSKIIVGGLLSSTLTSTLNKVPFLGDLPFVGKFFQHMSEQVTTTDLIIEITPRIVNIADHQVEFDVDKRLDRRLIREVNDDANEADNQ
jgi:type IV pilus assembly protein PilQ